MPNKEPGAIRQLFAFVGERNSKMRISILLAVLGEMFGIVPFLMVALLADELYRGTATIQRVLFFSGIAAICQLIKMLLTWRSSLMSHKISFTILKNIREAITDRMAKVPMGVMLETPTGTFKNLIVDNVAKLEDSMAHFMPELPSNIAAPLCSILLIFILDWRMGLASLITIPLGILFFAAMMRGYGPRMENYMRSANDMNSSLVEYVSGIQVIKAFIGRFFFQWMYDRTMSGTGYDIFRDYRLEIGEKLKQAPMGYFSEQNLGTIQTILTTTIADLEGYSMLAIEQMTSGVAMAALMSIMMFFFNPIIAILSLIGLLLGLLVLRWVRSRAAQYAPIYQEAQENLVSKTMEYIRGISVLRSFSKGEEGQREVRSAFQKKWDADYGQEKATAGVLRFYILVYKLMSCVLIAAAGLLFMAGKISLPYCLTFLFCAFTVYSDLETMGNSAFLSKKINTELDRLEEVTNIPQMDTSTDKLETSHYDITLDHVSFGYDKRQVIHDISLNIPEHTTCAIVGPSGSGKTTLCNLIARFWDVQDGAVRIGGKDVKNYTADSILEHISMVFQNVYLFHDSIENNIKFGKPDATHEEVEAAAKRACCHDFISALPDGYNTIIGEGGSTLSGGEKQRISIARAILKDAPIIILDEATSSVDPENEQALLSAISELTKNKTLISIAHRLSTVENADQIIVIDQGRIAQQGTHQSLISQEGIYRNFLNLKLASAGWQL